jgi:hypothetical protein
MYHLVHGSAKRTVDSSQSTVNSQVPGFWQGKAIRRLTT